MKECVMKKYLLIAGLLVTGSRISAQWWNPLKGKTENSQEDIKAIVDIHEGLAELEGRVGYLYSLSQLNMNSEFISDQLDVIKREIATLNWILYQFKGESPAHKAMIKETISNRINQLSATVAQLNASLKK